MIQQGVSAGESSSDPNGTGGMSIGRVMDYVEARLEAIKSREDEEDEDEEREKKDKEKSTSQGPAHGQGATASNTSRSNVGPNVSTKSNGASTANRSKDTVRLLFLFSYIQYLFPPVVS